MKPQLLAGIAAICLMAGQAISHLSRLAIPVLLFLLSAMALYADPGSISGRVLTAAGKGAAVPNAPVEARNPETKAIYKATMLPWAEAAAKQRQTWTHNRPRAQCLPARWHCVAACCV